MMQSNGPDGTSSTEIQESTFTDRARPRDRELVFLEDKPTRKSRLIAPLRFHHCRFGKEDGILMFGMGSGRRAFLQNSVVENIQPNKSRVYLH